MASIDTIADRSTGSTVAGKAYFETSTNKFIVYNGSSWVEIDSDGTGAVAFENRWGASFDGHDDYVGVSASSDFSFGTSDFSFSTWFNLDLISGYRAIVDFRQSNGNTLPSLFNSPNAGWKLYVWSGSSKVLNYDTTLTTGQWYHAVYTRSGTTGTLYLDGISVATGTDNFNYSLNGAPRWGGPAPGVTAGHFKGKIDEGSVFSSALSEPEVAALRDTTGPNPVPTSISSLSTVGWWRMGDGSNNSATSGGSIATITDSSGNGNDATQTDTNRQPVFADLTGETIYS